jgi:hypothetical protein
VPILRAQMQKHVMARYSLSEVIASILASKLASPDLSEAQVAAQFRASHGLGRCARAAAMRGGPAAPRGGAAMPLSLGFRV